MLWLKRTTSAVWFTAHVTRSRAEVLVDLNMARFASAVNGAPAEASAQATQTAWTLGQPASFVAQMAAHLKDLAEPGSVLLLGTGVISLAVLLLRQHLRILPEPLLEAQVSPGRLPEVAART